MLGKAKNPSRATIAARGQCAVAQLAWCALVAIACSGKQPSAISHSARDTTAGEPGPAAVRESSGEVPLPGARLCAAAVDDEYIFVVDEEAVLWRIDRATFQSSQLATLRATPRPAADPDDDELSCAVALAVDAGQIYIALVDSWDGAWDAPSQLFRLPRAGGEPVTIGAEPQMMRYLVADGGVLFYLSRITQEGSGSLLRLDPATGVQTIVAAGVTRFAVDRGTAFWATRAGELRSVDRHGERPRLLSRVLASVARIGVDTDHVYWSAEDRGLRRIARAGGEPQLVLAEESAATNFEHFAFEIVGSHVYWTSCEGGLGRSPITRSSGAAEILARRGSYDCDDLPVLLLATDDAGYWAAGPESGKRAPRLGRLALFYRDLTAQK